MEDYVEPFSEAINQALALERPRLVRLCASLTDDPASAEDLAQETLIQAWRIWSRLNDPAALSPWLAAIARNVCLRWRRSAARAPLIHPADPADLHQANIPNLRDDAVVRRVPGVCADALGIGAAAADPGCGWRYISVWCHRWSGEPAVRDYSPGAHPARTARAGIQHLFGDCDGGFTVRDHRRRCAHRVAWAAGDACRAGELLHPGVHWNVFSPGAAPDGSSRDR